MLGNVIVLTAASAYRFGPVEAVIILCIVWLLMPYVRTGSF